MTPKKTSWLKWFMTLATLAVVALTAEGAMAAGRVQWKSRTLKEDDGSWKIEITMFLNRAPDMAHIPVRFSFQPTMYYERMLSDDHPKEPVVRKVPLQHRQPLVESVDVGFMDPARGEIQKRTRFSFKVTRGHGFEAGEYKVTIKNGRTGRQIGQTARIIFDGENEVIDRRSMVFSGKKKKKKKDAEEESSEPEEEQPQKRELSPDDDAFWAGGPTEPEPEGPPPIEEKPGGCGCRVAGPSEPIGTTAVFALAIVAAFGFRRRTARGLGR